MDMSKPKIANRGPYCRALRTGGAIGQAHDGRSREGKFLRKIEAELLAQLPDYSFAQQLLVRRIARSLLQLELFDEKIASGSFTELDAHVMGGLNNNVRLGLRELGIRAAGAKKQTLASYLAEKAAK
jgi:hypothetical protein